jgi:hypothetical protein
LSDPNRAAAFLFWGNACVARMAPDRRWAGSACAGVDADEPFDRFSAQR